MPARNSSPAIIYAETLIDAEQPDRAREMLERVVDRGRRSGEAGLGYPLHLLAYVEFDVGHWQAARSIAAEGLHISIQSGQETIEVLAASILGTVEGALGRVDAARSLLEGALTLAMQTGRGGRAPRGGLGLLELSLDDHAATWAALEPAIERVLPLGLLEPSTLVADGAEALAGLGRTADAGRLLEAFEGPARRLDRRWAIAAAARCRGLISMAEDDLAGAARALEEAVAIGRELPRPLELGRSLLALGSVRRRRGSKKAARETLDEAVQIFDGLGAGTWMARASRESARIGGRHPQGTELSSIEEQIAGLVTFGTDQQGDRAGPPDQRQDRGVEPDPTLPQGRRGNTHRTRRHAARGTLKAGVSPVQRRAGGLTVISMDRQRLRQYLVERYVPGVSRQDLQSMASGLARAAEEAFPPPVIPFATSAARTFPGRTPASPGSRVLPRPWSSGSSTPRRSRTARILATDEFPARPSWVEITERGVR